MATQGYEYDDPLFLWSILFHTPVQPHIIQFIIQIFNYFSITNHYLIFKFAPLAADDLVKLDLAVHVDGYIAAVAHTVVVGNTENITGVKADLVKAAYDAAELAARLIKPGSTNKQVTAEMKKVADAYGVKCIAGVEMYQMKRYVIDGNKKVALREEPETKVDACTFEQYEAYAIDVEMTTGEGRPVEKDARTTVYKRIVGNKHNLKVKASRVFFNEVNSRYPTLPFTLRCMADEKNARMGISECVTKQLLQPYPVYYEKQNDLVAQFKFTILLMGGGTSKITGLPVSPQFVSDKVLPDDIKEILESEMKKKKSRGGKKK